MMNECLGAMVCWLGRSRADCLASGITTRFLQRVFDGCVGLSEVLLFPVYSGFGCPGCPGI